MRNEQVIETFLSLKEGKCKSSTGNLYREGNKLFSYNTCIAEFAGQNSLIVNVTKYSQSTSRIQNMIKKELMYYLHYNVRYHDGLHQGVQKLFLK